MSTETKERPILFNAAMVRALLDGRKTQTRRVVKPQPDCGPGFTEKQHRFALNQTAFTRPRSPYGIPGDRLWVRESFQPVIADHAINECHEPDFDRLDYKTGAGYRISYPATDGVQEFADFDTGDLCNRCKPSIHMPRWASRLTLEITGVRVERLNDISEADAMAEGISLDAAAHQWGRRSDDGVGRDAYIAAFRALWTSIYGPDAWAKNSWCWVYEFKVLTHPTAAPAGNPGETR